MATDTAALAEQIARLAEVAEARLRARASAVVLRDASQSDLITTSRVVLAYRRRKTLDEFSDAELETACTMLRRFTGSRIGAPSGADFP